MKWYHGIMLGAAIVLLAALGIVLSYNFGYRKGQKEAAVNIEFEPDTTRIDNIIVVSDPEPFEVEVIKHIYLHDTIWIYDDAYTELDYERKIYRGLDYYAEVSGFEPNLDSIMVRHTTTYIERPIIMDKEVKPFCTWGIQAGVGAQYGLIRKGFDVGPYIGIGFQFNF